MSSSWKQIKRYERWVLIAIVIILLMTFSISGITRSGCGKSRAAAADDLGGTFEVSPGRERSVSDEDMRALMRRYEPIYAPLGWGPSVRFAGEMVEDRRPRRLLGAWMHLVQVAAAEEAGYRVSDEELRDAIRDLVSRWVRQAGGTGFTAERYDQLLDGITRAAQRPYSKAEFEQTMRELLLKDKFLGDLVDLQRFAVDREAAFDRWKATRERVDLAFAALPAAGFADVVRPEEQTRSAVEAQHAVLGKVVDALREVRRLGALAEKWKKDNGDAWAESEAALLEKEPGKSSIGKTMPVDPWGTPYAYAKVGDAGRVTSAGPDAKPGTADDVTPAMVAALDALGTLRRAGDVLKKWYEGTGAWPAALADLTKVAPPKDGKPGVSPPLLLEVPKDPWGHELVWDAAAHTVASAGADGQAGTADDLVGTATPDGATLGVPTEFAVYVLGTKDAWGHALAVRFGAMRFEATSPGPDGVAGNDDDVKDGNGFDLEAFYAPVKRDFAFPTRREFEAVYVVPTLVSDELFTKAWSTLPEFRPDEREAWDTFRRNLDVAYVVREGEAEDAPAIDPADPVKGYKAAFRRELIEKKLLPEGAKGWPVPAATCFGDRKDAPAATTKDLPNPDVDKLYKLYLEKGWRLVALRDQFFSKLLDAVLKTSRDAAEAHQKWLDGGKTGAEPALVDFKATLAKWQDLQPGEGDAAQGVWFLRAFATEAGKPLERKEIEALPILGDYSIPSYLDPLKDGAYDVTPRFLRSGDAQAALHAIKKYPERDAKLEEIRDRADFWDRYLEHRALERAAKELEAVRLSLLKAPESKPGDPRPPAPDAAARLRAFTDAVQQAADARKLPMRTDRTGLFVGSAARGQRAPKAPETATEPEKQALARRAYVRSNGYATISRPDAGGGARPAQPGEVGAYVLRDGSRTLGETPTKTAYLVICAEQQDPVPEEFHGRAFVDFVRESAYDATGEWQRSGTRLHDRKGDVLRLLYRLYDDWDAVKADYKIRPNVDPQIPRDAGPAR